MAFGFLMLFSVVRFAANGWIDQLYIQPEFFFSYYGFEWVKPLGSYTYLLFATAGLSALGVMIGYRYRLSALLFFLSFTYIELMDKTTYLNHYYFVSLVSFVMILLPAHAAWSVDALRNPGQRAGKVPQWSVDVIKLLLGIVYVYAGLAKLNSDWLLEAKPLSIWLSAKTHILLIGPLLDETWVHYAFSWFGAFYDLTIPFFLLWRPTRGIAFFFVVAFHLMTGLLFPIGMFPYIMIVSSLIFLPAQWHRNLLEKAFHVLPDRLREKLDAASTDLPTDERTWRPHKLITAGLALLIVIQLLLPFRYLLYPGELFWTEQGYRFSWRVMLMEKAGYAVFHVRDPETGRQWEVAGYEHLTPNQEKMMATQPDMILQFAHHLEDHYRAGGAGDLEIAAEYAQLVEDGASDSARDFFQKVVDDFDAVVAESEAGDA